MQPAFRLCAGREFAVWVLLVAILSSAQAFIGVMLSYEYRRLLKSHGFVGSMSKKGCCWDNVVAESFFGSLKQERVHWRNYETRYEAQQDIMNYITMWYNSHRLHSYLDYHSPNNFEQINKLLDKVA